MDIEFFDPKDADFHGIKALLTGLLGGADYNASQLTDTVIAQVGVGKLPWQQRFFAADALQYMHIDLQIFNSPRWHTHKRR